MNNEKEIKIRQAIMSKAIKGEKMTSEDRLWLASHRMINLKYGFPYLNTDIIHFSENAKYTIYVKVEKLGYTGRIIPVFTVPGGKGKIISRTPLTDYSGKTTLGKPVKMLGLLVDLNNRESEFLYQSELGILQVGYQCDYYDDKQHLMVRKNSSLGDSNFAMTIDALEDNKFFYHCKSPMSDDFESLVFSVKWIKGDRAQGDGSLF